MTRKRAAGEGLPVGGRRGGTAAVAEKRHRLVFDANFVYIIYIFFFSRAQFSVPLTGRMVFCEPTSLV